MVGNELELFNVSLFVCAERQFLRLLTNKNKFARTLRRETVTNQPWPDTSLQELPGASRDTILNDASTLP